PFCVSGNNDRLAVPTVSSPPCRTWHRRFSWTHGYSTSVVCAPLTRGRGRKTAGWIKTLLHFHEAHNLLEWEWGFRRLTNALIRAPQLCTSWRIRHCVEVRISLYKAFFFRRQIVVRDTLSRFQNCC